MDYDKQISVTEWFEQINHKDTSSLRLEDNEKRERLGVLNEVIGVPFDKAVIFEATEISSDPGDYSHRFKEYLKEHSEDLCALRLIPKESHLPKLRMRGRKVKDVLDWFKEQKINSEQYRADFIPHPRETLWSTIFVVNQQGIFGEIVHGPHNILTQGFYQGAQPLFFSYNFKEWKLGDSAAMQHLHLILEKIKVNRDNEIILRQKLGATFAQGYLCGYFETTFSEEYGLWFIDYNRILGEMYSEFSLSITDSSLFNKYDGGIEKVGIEKQDSIENHPLVSGLPAYSGKVLGKVRIVKDEKSSFEDGEILVCVMTSPAYLPLMKKSSAIVTEQGGILSHAAIVSRELRKPCLTGAKDVTSILKDGDLIEVDTDTGVVRLLDKK